tara:strand:+ start:1615 stop:2757 length:1143 start_codon:yes stop_codon:yes gene_type:complete
LDNAATTQRAKSVVAAQSQFDLYENANIHRGIYDLSNQATQKFENTRTKIAQFLSSNNANTVAFTQGTTASINIVAQSFLAPKLKFGDNIVTTIMEHHANFIPWQMLAQKYQIELRIVPMDKNGDLDLIQLKSLIDRKTQLLAVSHISNTLGTIHPIDEIIGIAKSSEIPVLVDAAQSACHFEIGVDPLNCDFLTFSGHKMFGPFGVGILQVSEKYVEDMIPYNFGGGIIENVQIKKTNFRNFPHNLDAGTPNVSGVIGLAAALKFISEIGKSNMESHINKLTLLALDQLSQVSGIEIIGNPKKRIGIISFNLKNIHPHDVASFLNKDGIALRAGTHCTQPLLSAMGLHATARVSFSIYNNEEDINTLVVSLKELMKFWS